jgi:hypothetical protein
LARPSSLKHPKCPAAFRVEDVMKEIGPLYGVMFLVLMLVLISRRSR